MDLTTLLSDHVVKASLFYTVQFYILYFTTTYEKTACLIIVPAFIAYAAPNDRCTGWLGKDLELSTLTDCCIIVRHTYRLGICKKPDR